VQVVDTGHGLSVERDDDVVLAEAGGFGRTAGLDRQHANARRRGQPVMQDEASGQRHLLAGDAEIASSNPAVAQQTRHDEAYGVARDGEAEPLGGQNHRRVDPDDLASRRHERSAGVTWIERRVRLDDVVHQPAAPRPKRSAARADDAARDRAFEAVRIPNRDGDLTDPDGIGIAERHERQVAFVLGRAEEREIGIGIVADHVGAMVLTIGSGHGQLARTAHDVAVRHDEAVGGDHEARAGARGRLAFRIPLAPARRPHAVNPDDRRTDDFDRSNHRLGVGVDELAVVENRWKAHDTILGTPLTARAPRMGGWGAAFALPSSYCVWDDGGVRPTRRGGVHPWRGDNRTYIGYR